MTVKEEFDALENDPGKKQCPKYPAISCVSDSCEGCTFNDLYNKVHGETEGKPMTVDDKVIDAVRKSIRDNDGRILKSLLDGLDAMNGMTPDPNNENEAKRMADEIYVKEHGIPINDLDKIKEDKRRTGMSIDEVKEFLKKDSMQKAVLIGSEEEREKYYPAIVGFDEEKGRVVYDYGLLCQCFSDEFRKSDEESGDLVIDHDYDTDGVEWVEYNVVRSLPYWGEHAPIIKENNEEEESNQ